MPTGSCSPPDPEWLPPTGTVCAVVAALRDVGAAPAIGGSGLVAALGLGCDVGDWDVTTDAPVADVLTALAAAGLETTAAEVGDGRYATSARYQVVGADHPVEVLVGLAVRDGDRVVRLPSRVTGHAYGLPLADPAVWELAYRLLGRPVPAELLRTWLRRQV